MLFLLYYLSRNKNDKNMDIKCNNPKCGETHPMNTWTLIRLVMRFDGFVRRWDETLGVVNGPNDKDFKLSTLVCPGCSTPQSAALHPQYGEIAERVRAAGLAADALFGKVERVTSFNP
jgi:hypothetical protein